jgi:hypothetical protein
MSPTQSLTVIGFAPEATFGTFVAPTKFIPGTATPSTTKTVTAPSQSRGTRSQVLDVVTQTAAGLQVSAELIPEVLSTLIAGWFGTGSDAHTGSGSVGYTHTLTPQSALTSYSFEQDNDIYTHVVARQFVGNFIDQMTITYQASSIVTAQFTTVGQNEITPATPGTPSNPTPAITTLEPLDYSLLAASIGGSSTAYLISATLTASNQTQPVYSSNGKLYPNRLQATQRQVTFSTTHDFMDSTLYSEWAATAGSGGFVASGGMVLTLTTANDIPGTSVPYEVQFTLLNLRPQNQFALNSASDVLQQQLTWSVTQGATANEINGVIINSESTALS